MAQKRTIKKYLLWGLNLGGRNNLFPTPSQHLSPKSDMEACLDGKQQEKKNEKLRWTFQMTSIVGYCSFRVLFLSALHLSCLGSCADQPD